MYLYATSKFYKTFKKLSPIFCRKVMTTGSILGMKVCADIVSNAYGIAEIEHLMLEGYTGAKLLSDIFVTWFHWAASMNN